MRRQSIGHQSSPSKSELTIETEVRMMKKLVVLSLLLAGAVNLYAQADTRVWTRFTASSGDDNGYAVTVDNAGNAIIAGGTQGSITGGNAGRYDMWVAKYNAAG